MNMSDLAGLEKPLTKLVEATVSGIGVLGNHFFEFDAKAIERTGKAEAKVSGFKVIELAKSENEANLSKTAGIGELDKLIYQKNFNKESKRLKNIGDTLNGAKKVLESIDASEVSDKPVSEDWSTRFFDNAQDISDEKMQDIWGKILAGEVQQPGSYSLRTLEALKNISKNEADIFSRVSGLISDGSVILKLGNDGKDIFDTFGLKYRDILILQEAGLVLPTNTLSQKYTDKNIETFHIQIGFNDKFIYCKPNKNNIELPIFGLTQVGCDLLKLIKPKVNEAYLEQITQYLISLGCTIVVKDL